LIAAGEPGPPPVVTVPPGGVVFYPEAVGRSGLGNAESAGFALLGSR
jgi:hypothetical protein